MGIQRPHPLVAKGMFATDRPAHDSSMQAETYQAAPQGENARQDKVHGYEGPIKISQGGIFTNIGKDFLDVASQYDKTRGAIDDPSNFYDVNAYGVRVSSLHANRRLMRRFRGGKSILTGRAARGRMLLTIISTTSRATRTCMLLLVSS